MLMQSQFQDTVSRLGLDSTSVERDLAELIWMRCEAAFQQKSPQVATLLKAKKKLKYSEQPLTQQELQSLTDLISDLLFVGNTKMQNLKTAIKNTWLVCDRDNPNTKHYFEQLNQLRDYKRMADQSMRRMEKIQHKLKKLR